MSEHPLDERATVHICRAEVTARLLFSGTCKDCGRKTWFCGASYEWYGPDVTCLRCGRRWCDGEWMPLSFEPQSRRKSIESAKRQWRKVGA